MSNLTEEKTKQQEQKQQQQARTPDKRRLELNLYYYKRLELAGKTLSPKQEKKKKELQARLNEFKGVSGVSADDADNEGDNEGENEVVLKEDVKEEEEAELEIKKLKAEAYLKANKERAKERAKRIKTPVIVNGLEFGNNREAIAYIKKYLSEHEEIDDETLESFRTYAKTCKKGFGVTTNKEVCLRLGLIKRE